MRRISVVLVLLVLATAGGGCRKAESPQRPAQQRSKEASSVTAVSGSSEASAAALFARLKTSDYESWDVAPDYEQPRPAQGPHGDRVQVFMNPIGVKALDEGAPNGWPAGTTIVKNIYAGSTINQIAAMEKQPDGTWFWAEWDTAGKTVAAGPSLDACESCHAQGIDMALSVSLP